MPILSLKLLRKMYQDDGWGVTRAACSLLSMLEPAHVVGPTAVLDG